MQNAVSALAFSAIAAMPASAVTLIPALAAVRPSTGGVPLSIRPMPGRGSNGRSIVNWSDCANQPQIGWATRSWISFETKTKAGAPGPPLRNL